jgi:hypothetical protein
MAQRFKIAGTVYRLDTIDEITMTDVLLFNAQSEDMGLHRAWSDVERLGDTFAALSEREAETHPEKHLMIAASMWAARRIKGEDVTLEDVLGVRIYKDVEFLPDTSDRAPGKAKGAKRSPAKKAAKPKHSASARPAEPAPDPSEA